MMLYPAMNELLTQVPSRYKLVNVVAARARQIANEAEAAEELLDDKPVSIAIREIAQGKVPDLTAPAGDPTEMESAFLRAQAETEQGADDGDAEAGQETGTETPEASSLL